MMKWKQTNFTQCHDRASYGLRSCLNCVTIVPQLCYDRASTVSRLCLNCVTIVPQLCHDPAFAVCDFWYHRPRAMRKRKIQPRKVSSSAMATQTPTSP